MNDLTKLIKITIVRLENRKKASGRIYFGACICVCQLRAEKYTPHDRTL